MRSAPVGYSTFDSSAIDNLESHDTRRRKKRGRSRLCLVSISGVVLFIASLCVLSVNVRLQKPAPRLDDPLVASTTGPGIGFDLTPSYGTVAVRYHNGSTINVAKVQADTEYQEMMKRFSVGGKKFDNVWRDYCGRMIDYSWPRILKMLREALGIPSTPDVARLSRLIAKLQSVAEQWTSEKVQAAVIATPAFPALCKDDVVEAAKLNGIVPLTNRRLLLSQPYELSTAFFGAGFGHCSNFTDLHACNAEEKNPTALSVLSVSLSNATLFLRRAHMINFHGDVLFENDLLVDYELGSSIMPDESEEAQVYWSRISGRVLELCRRRYWPKYPFDRVLLFGESAGHPSLLSHLRDTVPQLQETMPDFVLQDPAYIAARGAAQLAKRAREDWALVAR